ncbi:hypothetical protein HAX54_047623 [Datura stramonium]|uniref:Uncharacterized protein n=1 Tax=Datura stramonium TaxID=4076 RepID=A0ABS8STG6_DATST|nr:hypothetical protein [Datura stramonium]
MRAMAGPMQPLSLRIGRCNTNQLTACRKGRHGGGEALWHEASLGWKLFKQLDLYFNWKRNFKSQVKFIREQGKKKLTTINTLLFSCNSHVLEKLEFLNFEKGFKGHFTPAWQGSSNGILSSARRLHPGAIHHAMQPFLTALAGLT